MSKNIPDSDQQSISFLNLTTFKNVSWVSDLYTQNGDTNNYLRMTNYNGMKTQPMHKLYIQ